MTIISLQPYFFYLARDTGFDSVQIYSSQVKCLELRTDFCLTLEELKLAEQMEPEFGPAVLISDRVLLLKLVLQW